jgi:glycosyltransferase involved in cell wall biosynthesis
MNQDEQKSADSMRGELAVTIITPSFNYAQFIEECVFSVKVESSSISLTHIVQDGLSTDKTLEVLSNIQSRKLKVVSEEDKGQSDALNRALSLIGDNELVGWLNADEYYLAGTIDHFYQAALDNPDVDVFFGDCLFVDKEGKLLRSLPSHRMSKYVLRHYGCFIPSCTLFVRASALKKIGWDTGFRRSMDWDLYLSMSKRFKFKHLKLTAAAFRVHDGQVTNTPESFDEEEFVRLREKHAITKSSAKTAAAYLLHALLKLLGGGYLKQLRYRKLHGQKITN